MMSESRTDTLINRIASAEESGGEFAQFEAAAAGQPGEWERLARALRDELHMRSALSDALAGDARAEIDRAYATESRSAVSGPRIHVLRNWTGWAAAAALALAWTLTIVLGPAGGPLPLEHVSPTTQFVSLSADEALEQYLRAGESEGRIVAELPAVLVESYAAEDGRIEVFYVRQLLERDRIAHVYNLAEDEHGSFVPVEVNPASFLSSPSSL